MENKDINEDVREIQKYVVKMRKTYSDTISKYYEQNNKIDIKLLEKREFKPEPRFEIPKEFTLEEIFLDSLNEDLADKELINVLREKLRNLEIISKQCTGKKNCVIYKQLTEK